MKTSKLWLPGLLVAAIAGMPFQIHAQETNRPAIEKKEGKAKRTTVPFHGKIKAVDLTAKSISVGSLVVQITPETRFLKSGKPATLEDGMAGEEIGGTYKKTEDGKLQALTVHFGPKEDKPMAKKSGVKSE